MKIVQIITRLDLAGGAQTHVETLCRSLIAGGHTVYLMSGSGKVHHPELESIVHSYSGIKHLRRNIHLYHDFLAFLEIRRELKRLNPDLVAAHTSKAGIVGRLAAWSLGIPTVYNAHGWAFTDGVGTFKKHLYRLFEKWVGFITDGIINVSHYDQQLALTKKVAGKQKMKVIHNGVPTVGMTADPEKQPPVVIMVARFAEPKEQSALVEALKELQAKDWRLWLVGDGPLLGSVKKQAASLGLQGRIEFLGSRKDVHSLLSSSQIFVLLSRWEGLPISILEAMQTGLPILASDVGGVTETIVDGSNGFLIPRGNRQELIDKMALLLDNPDIRKKMGEASETLYSNHFTLEEMVKQTVLFYEQTAALKRGGELYEDKRN